MDAVRASSEPTSYQAWYDRQVDEHLARYAGRDLVADHKRAVDRAKAAISFGAQVSTRRLIESEVRRYRKHPSGIDVVSWGISLLSPSEILARAESIYEGLRNDRSRRVTNIHLINAAAVLIYARELCRQDKAQAA